jgi:hypothetical protein
VYPNDSIIDTSQQGADMLTLAQAKKLCGMDPRTTARWYAQGYYMKADGGWYMNDGYGKEYVKYYTGS